MKMKPKPQRHINICLLEQLELKMTIPNVDKDTENLDRSCIASGNVN